MQMDVAKGKATQGSTVTLPYLRVANVQDGYVDLSVVKKITLKCSEVNRYRLRLGDVLFTEGGDFDKLGRGTVWNGEIEPCFHQNHVFAVRPDCDYLLPEFLAFQAASEYGRRYFQLSSKQSTNLASINSTQLKQFPVLVPPLPEQRKINEILRTWDQAIEMTEALLATARIQKHGLMQILLTGKYRFPEFEGQEWREVRLGDVVSLSKERLDPRKEHEACRCIELEHIESKTGRLLGSAQSNQQASIKAVFNPGDVLFGKLRPYLRKFIAPDFKGVCSTEIWVLQPKT